LSRTRLHDRQPWRFGSHAVSPCLGAEFVGLIDANLTQPASTIRRVTRADRSTGGSRLLAVFTPVVTILVWPVGVILLWLSSRWIIREKLIGTFVLPGGLLPAWLIATNVRSNCQSAIGAPIAAGQPGCTPSLAYQITHPAPSWAFNHVFGPIVLLLLVALPLLAAFYLEVRLASSPLRISAKQPAKQ